MSSIYRRSEPTIGVLAGWQFYRTATNLSYLAPIYRGISKAGRELGCNLLLSCGIGPSASPTDPLKPAWPIASTDQDYVPVDSSNTDGLIVVVPLHSQARSEFVQNMIRANHPVLFIGSGEAGPSIVTDNSGGIQEALRHLVNHGHRKIAFIAGSQDDLQGDTGERLRAYQQCCEIYNLEKNINLVAYGRHFFSGGYLAMQQILASGCEFTAVLASNDESALGAMSALNAAGLQVPEDVAVIGFDNRFEDAVQEPGLSSIHIPLFDIGYHAVELLLQNIKEKTPLAEMVKVGTRLVIRRSCGCNKGEILADRHDQGEVVHPADLDAQSAQMAETIAKIVMN
jgi:DNA-binding LacI/PurR family transcriptional regulator